MIYLDNGATTFPKPKVVTDKIMECYLGYAGNPGRSGHKLAMKMDLEIYETREKICKLINGTEVLNVIFTFNATDSLNLAIKGVLEEGDHVITTSMEHNSVLRPLNQLRKDGKIELSIVYADDKGYIDPQKIFEALTPNTKMIVTTHMSNVFGTIVDIKAIGDFCKENNILYLVDASQSIGVLDIDVQEMNIDLLAFPGHKALFGPMGTGALYIKEGIIVKPLKEGGTGSYSHSIDQPDLYPDSLESGTPNGVGIIALGKGIDFINEVGIENIRNHEMSLKNHFIELLKDNEDVILYGTLDDRQGAVVSLNVKDMDSSEISYILSDEFDIYTRPGFHCAPLAHKTMGTEELGAIRFSFGYYNTLEEIDKTVEALLNIIERNKTQ